MFMREGEERDCLVGVWEGGRRKGRGEEGREKERERE